MDAAHAVARQHSPARGPAVARDQAAGPGDPPTGAPPPEPAGGRPEGVETAEARDGDNRDGDTATGERSGRGSGGSGSSAKGLTELESRVLAFEQRWWRYPGAKEDAIRAEFGMSPTRYYQLLNVLIDSRAALAAEPMLVHRLQQRRERNRRARSGRLIHAERAGSAGLGGAEE